MIHGTNPICISIWMVVFELISLGNDGKESGKDEDKDQKLSECR